MKVRPNKTSSKDAENAMRVETEIPVCSDIQNFTLHRKLTRKSCQLYNN